MEKSQDGWPALAEMFDCDVSTALKRKDELKACGAIFYRWKGRPRRKVMSFFPSIVRTWMQLKASKGEMF